MVGWNRAGATAHTADRRASSRSSTCRRRSSSCMRKGVRVIGRLVCFRDPILAQAAWTAGKRAEVDPDAGRAAATAGTAASPTSPNPAVRRYNIAIAVAAAKSAWTTSSTTTSAGRTGRSRRWSSPACRYARAAAIVSFLAETRTRAEAATGRSSARRSSAWRPRDPTRSPRTSRRWPATSTTSRRWSIPRTGRRASTAWRPERAAVRHRPAFARGLPARRPRHRRPARSVAPGLLARGRLRPPQVEDEIRGARDAGIASTCSGTRR